MTEVGDDPDPLPEPPDGPEDDRFVYVVTAAVFEALRQNTAAFDSEQEPPPDLPLLSRQ